jgi:DNA-binding transcriptional ArsR family regulator
MSLESMGSAEPEPGTGTPREPAAGGQAPADGQAGPDADRPAGPERFRLLDDPVAIRALAHPLRLELMSVTGHAGQITTADAARELGISHGLASHHLRQLAKYGFVQQVGGKDRRERPWRLTYTSMSWRETVVRPDVDTAAQVYEEVLAERAVAGLRSWLRRRGSWPAPWRQHTGLGQSTVYLTLPELAELELAMEALITRYVTERPLDDVGSRPEGSVPVDITQIITIPHGPPPGAA